MHVIKRRLVFGAFILVSLLHLGAAWTHQLTLSHISKPLLMPLLVWWFLLRTRNSSIRLHKFFVAGLIFSAFGDVFLMFRTNTTTANDNFYLLAGVAAFLAAQVAYTMGFLSKYNIKASFLWQRPMGLLPIVAYLTGMLWWLPGLRVFPLWAYGVAISAMLASAVNLRGWVPGRAWYRVLSGATLFVLSDSLLALELFGKALPQNGFWVMLTYIAAQFLLAIGISEID